MFIYKHLRIFLTISSILSIWTCIGAMQIFSSDANAADLLLFENFNGKAETLKNKVMKLNNADIVPGNGKNTALLLNGEGYAELTAPTGFNSKQGTISFWVKPLWKQPGSTNSHTFMSMRWNDNKNGYMAISHGWWEPQGKNRLYFILNNQEFLHCSTKRTFDSNAWTLITATWGTSPERYCTLYIDSEKAAQSKLSPPYADKFQPASALYLGTDKGAANRRDRFAYALIDDVRLLDYPLSDREVFDLYNSQKNTWPSNELQEHWLSKYRGLPLRRLRNRDGVLLESRIVFDEGWQWALSKDSVNSTLAKLKKAGFNVYVPCIWHGRGARFPTTLTYYESTLSETITKGFDPLAYLISQAHSMGIEVHPWFTVSRRENERYPEFYDDGTPDNAYDVHKKEFRQFITSLIIDVVTRYDVDGINLDYIRTMGICTSTACKNDYQQTTQHQLMADYYLRPANAASRKRIQAWQDNAITDIVRTVSDQAKQVRPALVISTDGHPKPSTEKRNLQGQNEILWANNNWIDVIYMMDYHRNIDYRTADAVRAELNNPDKLVILFGNYDRLENQAIPRPGPLVASYADFAQHEWPSSGIAFYIFTQMTDEQAVSLKNGPFKEDALPYWSSANSVKATTPPSPTN